MITNVSNIGWNLDGWRCDVTFCDDSFFFFFSFFFCNLYQILFTCIGYLLPVSDIYYLYFVNRWKRFLNMICSQINFSLSVNCDDWNDWIQGPSFFRNNILRFIFFFSNFLFSLFFSFSSSTILISPDQLK